MKSLLLIFLLVISCRKDTLHPVKGSIVQAVYGLGVIRSENTYNARAAIVNSVDRFHVQEGEELKKGDNLFTSDQGITYKAPFDGRVTSIPVGIKENLFPQSLILSLVDLKHLYLEVSLEQQAAMLLRQGIKAEVSFEFFRSKKFFGKISSIYPKNDQFVAKVILPKWPQGVLPGMTADVAFEVDKKEQTTLVPTKAIANGHIVIKRGKRSKKIKLQIGLEDEEKSEVLSPELLETDEIILP
jgi:macrolide-specific efflux system membrane fusion protein